MMEVSLTNTNQLVECARGVSRGRVWGVSGVCLGCVQGCVCAVCEGVSVLCVRVCLGCV